MFYFIFYLKGSGKDRAVQGLTERAKKSFKCNEGSLHMELWAEWVICSTRAGHLNITPGNM